MNLFCPFCRNENVKKDETPINLGFAKQITENQHIVCVSNDIPIYTQDSLMEFSMNAYNYYCTGCGMVFQKLDEQSFDKLKQL